MLRAGELSAMQLAHRHGNHLQPPGSRPKPAGCGLSADDEESEDRGAQHGYH